MGKVVYYIFFHLIFIRENLKKKWKKTERLLVRKCQKDINLQFIIIL